MIEFRQKLYVSPLAPYALLAVGGLLVLSCLQQAGVLGVYVLDVALGTETWNPSVVVQRLINLVVTVAWGGLAVAGGQALRSAQNDAQRRRELYRDQPWMCNRQWATGQIQTDHRSITALFWVAMTGLATFLIVHLHALLAKPAADRSYWLAIGLVVTMYVVLRGFLLNRKWRSSELRLGTIPGVIGGPFQAVVLLNQAFPVGTPFRVTLRCEHLQWSHRSKSSGIKVDKLWQADAVVKPFSDAGMPGKTGLPVYFAVPHDCRATTLDDIKEGSALQSIRWSLSVKLDDDSDFRSIQFEVPVFLTEASSPKYREDPTVLHSYTKAVTPESVLAGMIYRCESIAGGERIEFSLRRWTYIIAAFVVSIVCGACVVAIASLLSPWPLILIAALVPGAVGALSLITALEMLLWHAQLTIAAATVEIVAGYPGWTKRLSLARGDAEVLEPQVEFATAHSDFRRIQIRSASTFAAQEAYLAKIENDEESSESLEPAEVVCITVIKRLPGRQAAAAVRDWLAERLGRSSTSTDMTSERS